MGLPASIYRDEYRSSMNVFDNFARVTLVNVDGPFEPSENAPAAVLVKGNDPGTVVVRAVRNYSASDETHDVIRGMMGGSYVSTSDSRFSQAVEKIVGGRFYGAVALHDRVE